MRKSGFTSIKILAISKIFKTSIKVLKFDETILAEAVLVIDKLTNDKILEYRYKDHNLTDELLLFYKARLAFN